MTRIVHALLIGLLGTPAAWSQPAPPEEAPSPWSTWVDSNHTVFGDPRPTGILPLAEIIVITDQQAKYLGGERTALQSLTSDAAVDVSVRPIALDLFGFTRRVLEALC